MSTWQFEATDEHDTERLAAALARLLPERMVVGLEGTLGAGKTRFVQALAAAAGHDRSQVVSPTFVLVQEHLGDRPIRHFDAYRLRDDDEFLALGVEEYFDAPGWSFVEWSDRVERCLPAERLDIRIVVTGETSRRFELRAAGSEAEAVLARLPAGLTR